MATYDTEIAALQDVTSGQTLAEAGGVGHAAVENRQNAAARALAAYLNSGDIQYREYDAGWPLRGDLPDGTLVMWIKRDPNDPDPPINADYALTGVDIALLAQP